MEEEGLVKAFRAWDWDGCATSPKAGDGLATSGVATSGVAASPKAGDGLATSGFAASPIAQGRGRPCYLWRCYLRRCSIAQGRGRPCYLWRCSLFQGRGRPCYLRILLLCSHFCSFRIQPMMSRRRASRSRSSPVMASRKACAAFACGWAGLFLMANASVLA